MLRHSATALAHVTDDNRRRFVQSSALMCVGALYTSVGVQNG